MTDVIVRRWDDFGAPNLSGSNTLSAVLDAVLVNGYGNSPGLGWTKPFGNVGGVHVYRMPTGTPGYFLRVDDSAYKTAGDDYRYAKVTSYEDMSDINTGVGKVPLPDTSDKWQEFGTWFYGKVGYTRGAWIILAGPGWFHLICEMHSSTPALPFDKSAWGIGGNALHYYGPLMDVSQSDAYAIALTRGIGSLDSWNIYYYMQNSHLMGDGRIFVHRASDQAASCITALSRNMGLNSYFDTRYPNNRGIIMMDDVKVIDYKRGAAVLPYEYRGIIPLVHVALHTGGSMYTAGVRSLDTIVKDGVTYLCIHAPGGNPDTPLCYFFALSY